MGSGVWPLAVATRLAKPPVLPVAEPAPWACPTDLIRGAGRGPPGWSSLHEAPRAQRTVLAEWSPGGPSVHRLDRGIDPGGLTGVICECDGRSVCGARPAGRGAAAPLRVAPGGGACRCTRAGFRLPRGCRGQDRIGRVRAISTGQLRGLLRFHLRPIDVVVFHGSRRDLVLRRVSRLDAFSGYPVRT